MFKLLANVFGILIQVVLIPIVLVVSIPLGILKARRDQKSRILFTGSEQSLLAKAQRVLRMENNGLLAPDRDLVEVAKCIEDSRCDYQTIKAREKFDASFADFVLPRIYECQVSSWARIVEFFRLDDYRSVEADSHVDESPGVAELVRGLQNYIAGYEKETGALPRMVMLDRNVHLLFANAGILRESESYFGKTSIVPAAGIEGGLIWRALSWPAPKSDSRDGDDIPF